MFRSGGMKEEENRENGWRDKWREKEEEGGKKQGRERGWAKKKKEDKTGKRYIESRNPE
jgi:hypothetical protein